MQATAAGYELDVERGPEWLLIRVRNVDPAELDAWALTNHIWSVLRQHFTYRLVLELQELPSLSDELIERLIELRSRVDAHEGTMRLCGLSSKNRQVMHACHGDEQLHPYRDRQDAVVGTQWPSQPR
jgi:hypothetical protein